MTPAGLLVIANADAGSTETDAIEAAAAVLREAADVTVRRSETLGDLNAILDSAGGRTVVAAGGDGSVHALVDALHRRGELSRRPIGLLPLGTGNDLARGLGLPLNPQEAARALLAGRARTLDLIIDDAGEVAVNAVHIGIGAEAARVATRFKGVLGPAAFPVGSAVAGVTQTGWELRVAVDGAVLHEGQTLMVGLSNSSTIGAGTPLAPGAQPDDGLIDVLVAVATGPLARTGYAVDLRRGEHVSRDDVVTARAQRVEVTGESFSYNADGELRGPVTARTWRVLPGSWSILV